tara:strand:+ start:577 stop:780 length:204 start_codon:yes stop_codon:yes gene_type:complete
MFISIIYKGVELSVEYDYTKEIPATYLDDAEPSEVSINDIKHESIDFMDLLEDSIEDIESKILATHE